MHHVVPSELLHQFGIAVAEVKPMTHDFFAKCKYQLVKRKINGRTRAKVTRF